MCLVIIDFKKNARHIKKKSFIKIFAIAWEKIIKSYSYSLKKINTLRRKIMKNFVFFNRLCMLFVALNATGAVLHANANPSLLQPCPAIRTTDASKTFGIEKLQTGSSSHKCGQLTAVEMAQGLRFNKKKNHSEKQTVIYSKDVNRKGKAFVIEKPGYYKLGEDIVFKPRTSKSDSKGSSSRRSKKIAAAPNTIAITIKANNVYLDLNNHTISQAGLQPNVTGISVLGNNIAITNGSIRNMSQFGIVLNPGTYSVDIDHVNILETGLYTNGSVTTTEAIALLLNGSSIGSKATAVTDVHVTNSEFSFGQSNFVGVSNTFVTGAAAGIYSTHAINVLIENCQASNIIAPFAASMGGFISNASKNIQYNNSQSNKLNSGGVLIGFGNIPTPTGEITDGFTVIGCSSSGHTTNTGRIFIYAAFGIKNGFLSNYEAFESSYTGTALKDASGAALGVGGCCVISASNVVVEGFKVYNLSSTGDFTHGLHVIGSSNVVVKDSEALSLINTVGESSAFGTARNDRPLTTVSTNVTFQRCTAFNVQSGATVTGPNATGGAGFRMHNVINGFIDECSAAEVSALGSNFGCGLQVTGTLTESVTTGKSQFNQNSHYGILDQSVPAGSTIANNSNTYFNNWAQSNGVNNFNIPSINGTDMIVSYSDLLINTDVNPYANVAVPSTP
jgi:hypothetical protein